MPLGTTHKVSIPSTTPTGPFLTDDAPDTYARKFPIQKNVLDLLDSLEWKYLGSDPQQQFLDIGCGTGNVTLQHILPRCPPCRRIVATDFSAKMIKYAQEHFPHPKIEYRQLDIGLEVDQFLAEHGTFQRVYSLKALHWVKDQARAYANISRLLVPGGECLLVYLGRCEMFDLFRRKAKLEPWTKYSEILESAVSRTHDITDVAELKAYVENFVRSAGLTLITLDVWERERSSLSTEKAVEMFLMTNPVLPILPEEEKQAFIADARTHVPGWLAAYHENKQSQFTCLIVHAWKP